MWDWINQLITDNIQTASNTINVFRYIPPAEWTAIVARTSTYDCTEAVQAAINSTAFGAGATASGAYVTFPDGQYTFNTALELKRKCGLIGMNSGLGDAAGVVFSFPNGTDGIVIHRQNTLAGGLEAPPTNGADGSEVRGILIRGAGYSPGNVSGVVMRARAVFTGVRVEKYQGDGWRIVADAVTADPARTGNANLFNMTMCAASECWGNGLYVDGLDVNAGNIVGFNSINNGLWGVFDSSFLGNTFTGAHTSANGRRGQVSHLGNRYYLKHDAVAGTTEPGTNAAVWVLIGAGGVTFYYPAWVSGTDYQPGGAFKSDNANSDSLFIGCYSESGQPPSVILHPATVIGGEHGADFAPESTGHRNIAGRLTPFTVVSRATDAPLTMGVAQRTGELLSYHAPGDNAVGLSPATFDAASGDWVVRHARLSARTPVRYTTDLSKFNVGRSSAVGGGHVRFPRGAFMGHRMVDSGTAPPTSGEAGRGDIRINESAAPGQPSYWQCTASGVNGSTAVWTAGPVL